MRTVVLALGSNLGDRAANLREAVTRLAQFVEDIRCSSAVETLPIDCAESAPVFLNAVLCGQTDLEPLPLLRACQQIEREMGRPAVRAHHADRIIDVDLLLLEDTAFDHPDLTLPHPRMHLRDFVMVPLAEIASDLWLEQANATVSDALAAVEMKSVTKTGIPY